MKTITEKGRVRAGIRCLVAVVVLLSTLVDAALVFAHVQNPIGTKLTGTWYADLPAYEFGGHGRLKARNPSKQTLSVRCKIKLTVSATGENEEGTHSVEWQGTDTWSKRFVLPPRFNGKPGLAGPFRWSLKIIYPYQRRFPRISTFDAITKFHCHKLS